MARTPGKKQAPAKLEEDDEAEGWEDAVVEADGKESEADLRLRDWRDVERYREMKELRRLVDDDYGLEEIFHVPVRPRAEPGIPARAGGKTQKAEPARHPAKAAGKHPTKIRPGAKAHKAPAKIKAKAKRR
jgi:hypothetical protein